MQPVAASHSFQDQEWLESLNADRKAANIDRVTYETFEIVMDRLEKEWFDLVRYVPLQPDQKCL